MSESTPGSTKGTKSLVANRAFTLYFSSFFVSNVGMFMQALGVPFVLYSLTKSATWVGAGGFCGQFAAFLVTPLAGTLADRVSRRTVLIVSQIVQLGAAIVLWILASVGALTPWRILFVLVIAGLGAGFQHTTAQALMPQVVDPAHFKSAMRAFPLCFNLPRAFGPLIAGLVLKEYGPATTFAVNALSFLPFIAVLALMRLRPIVQAVTLVSWRKQFVEGVRYARANPRLKSAVTLVFVMSLLGMSVLSHVADIGSEIYRVKADGLGLISAAVGIGSVVASLAVVAIGDSRNQFGLGIFGISVQGIAVVLAVATHAFPVGLGAFFLFGLGNLIAGISLSVVIQTTTNDLYRGRVGSLYMSGFLLGGPLGALTIGILGDRFGLARVVEVFGALLTIYSVRMWFKYAAVLRSRRVALSES